MSLIVLAYSFARAITLMRARVKYSHSPSTWTSRYLSDVLLERITMSLGYEISTFIEDTDAQSLTTIVLDMVTGQKSRIQSTYLFCADGA